MIEKNKMYLTPEIEVVELENESILCSSVNPLSDDNSYEDLF